MRLRSLRLRLMGSDGGLLLPSPLGAGVSSALTFFFWRRGMGCEAVGVSVEDEYMLWRVGVSCGIPGAGFLLLVGFFLEDEGPDAFSGSCPDGVLRSNERGQLWYESERHTWSTCCPASAGCETTALMAGLGVRRSSDVLTDAELEAPQASVPWVECRASGPVDWLFACAEIALIWTGWQQAGSE